MRRYFSLGLGWEKLIFITIFCIKSKTVVTHMHMHTYMNTHINAILVRITNSDIKPDTFSHFPYCSFGISYHFFPSPVFVLLRSYHKPETNSCSFWSHERVYHLYCITIAWNLLGLIDLHFHWNFLRLLNGFLFPSSQQFYSCFYYKMK